MPEPTEASSSGPIELMLARSLFRADKWDPDRDNSKPFEWDDQRQTYLKRANRLIRTFEKDGLGLARVSALPAAPGHHRTTISKTTAGEPP